MTPTIRPLRAADRAAVVSLGADVFQGFGEYREAVRGWTENPAMRTLVALDPAGACGGFAIVALTREPGGVTGQLLAIGVAPARSRAGWGGELLDAAVDVLRREGASWGARQIRLEVADDNPAALALFASRGFTRPPPATLQAARATYGSGRSAVVLTLALS